MNKTLIQMRIAEFEAAMAIPLVSRREQGRKNDS